MNSWRFLIRTLTYHWRTNLAVLLGVAAGTAVLAGALIVGDSVRESLRTMTLVRLGEVDHVLQGPRFVQEYLARDLVAQPGFDDKFATAAPAIVLSATVEHVTKTAEGTTGSTRAGRVQLFGLNEAGWRLIDRDRSPPSGSEVVLNSRLASQLGVKAGDDVILAVELPSDIPRDTLLGKRDENGVEWPVTVREILPEESGPGRFGLLPDQQLPVSAFVSLSDLQERLGLAKKEASRRDPVTKPARVNAIFVSARKPADGMGESAEQAAELLNRLLDQSLQLADLHLRVTSVEKQGYVTVESDRMILDPNAVQAAERTAKALRVEATSPVMVYIANSIRPTKADSDAGAATPERISRYAVVVGLDPNLMQPGRSGPFGSYEYVGDAPASPLNDPDPTASKIPGIVINDWLASDLRVQLGDELELSWHQVGSHGELPEETGRFLVRGIVKLEGTVAADRGLVPEVPGITNVKSFAEWEAPFPMKKVTARDDDYWKVYRATPKAFVSLDTAQELWKNRYGKETSFRVAATGTDFADFQVRFQDRLRHELKPAENGIRFRPVKSEGLRAAAGTTDFGGLFLGFSLFLILSAAILIGLLFRLGIDRRAASVGLLSATGLGPKRIFRLLLAEGAVVVALGVAVGLIVAVAYARLMVHGLKTWWVGAIGTRFLDVYIEPVSLAIGGLGAALVALIALAWGLRGLGRIPARRLLGGNSTPDESIRVRSQRGRRSGRRALVCGLLAIGLTLAVVVGAVPNREAFSGFSIPTILFFVVGLLALASGLWGLGWWIDSDGRAAVRGNGAAGITRLGIRNAARHRSRSILSTALIATATFLIVAIAAGHRNPAVETPDRNSGNGGFTLVAESSVPVLHSLNTVEGRTKLGLDEPIAAKTLKGVRQVVPLRVNPGENASCLNIYRTTQPTILGATQEMIERGGFKFADTRAAEPWKLLEKPDLDGSIPVLGDMNTLQYSLHLGMGGVFEIRGEDNQPRKLKIVGMYDGSVFQGVLVMHERFFQELFPSRVGYQYFLVDVVPGADSREVSDLLESRLTGLDAERVADRLASFLAVQNTYLSTFQALGGLGLLLGTIGLGTVMLRNILERRSELALLRAVGFRKQSLAGLVLAENALLLGWGLFCGTVSALLAMGPHLLATGADFPWRDVLALLAAVFVVGMLTAWMAARSAMRTPVVATLRSE